MIDLLAALRKAAILAACVAVAGLAGCKAPDQDPEADAAARATYEDIRTGSPDLQARLAPVLKTSPTTAAELVKVRSFLPPGQPRSGRATGWNYVTQAGQGKTALLTHEYDYPGQVVLAQLALQRPEGAKAWLVSNFHVQVATTRELESNRFSLIGKSPVHYAFLAAMILSLGAMLAAMVKVARTENLKRKWLWVIASLFCVVGLKLNWFNGALTWGLTIGLLNAGVVSGTSRFDPWMLSFSLPLGAVLILTGVWARPKVKPIPDEMF